MRWALLGLLAAGCGPQGAPGELLYQGCGMLGPDGSCWADAGSVTVWTSGAPVAADGVTVAGTAVDGGLRYEVVVSAPLTITVGGREVLRVTPAVGACPGESPLDAAWCLRVRAREQLAGGEPAAAAPLFDEAARAFEGLGRARDASLQRDRAAWVRAQADGGAVVQAGPPGADALAWLMRARLAELTLRQAGLLHAARRVQRRVVEVETRVGTADTLADARLVAARLALALGDIDAVLSTLSEVLAAPGSGCEGTDRAAHAGWQVGQLWWTRTAEVPSLLARAAEALEEAQRAPCAGRGRPDDRAVDLALLRFAQGDPAGAAAALEAVGAGARAETRLWAHLLRGEVARASDPAAALASADAAWAVGREAGLAEARWLARDLRAEALRQAGDVAGATAAHDAAEDELERVAALTPLLGGRAAFLDQRAVATGRHVDAMVATGRLEAALDTARTWRRAVAVGIWSAVRLDSADTGLAEGLRGELDRLEAARAERSALEASLRVVPASEQAATAAALAAVREREEALLDAAVAAVAEVNPARGRGREPGEALLVVVPTGARGAGAWRALWQDDQGIVAGSEVPDPAVWGAPERLLPVPADRLRAPAVVSLLLPAALESLDLHLAPVQGEPWALAVPVRWSLDLDAPPVAAGGRAIVLGDPEGRLAGARAEATAAATALAAAGLQVVSLGYGSRRGALRDALEPGGVGWLHVAAHGLADGDDPRLLLADGTTWSMRDALALETPPRRALLTGCHAAAAGGLTGSGAGLAHALVRAGAEAVVAPWTEVGDDAAGAFAAALTRARPWEARPEVAFQSALREAAASGSLDAVRGFRLVTR